MVQNFFRASLGIPSGPGALLLFRVRTEVSNSSVVKSGKFSRSKSTSGHCGCTRNRAVTILSIVALHDGRWRAGAPFLGHNFVTQTPRIGINVVPKFPPAVSLAPVHDSAEKLSRSFVDIRLTNSARILALMAARFALRHVLLSSAISSVNRRRVACHDGAETKSSIVDVTNASAPSYPGFACAPREMTSVNLTTSSSLVIHRRGPFRDAETYGLYHADQKQCTGSHYPCNPPPPFSQRSSKEETQTLRLRQGSCLSARGAGKYAPALAKKSKHALIQTINIVAEVLDSLVRGEHDLLRVPGPEGSRTETVWDPNAWIPVPILFADQERVGTEFSGELI
ncbi:hypothetical protein J6590_058972 [Homalodisca vitripennis]|nr:hypothetical protein J6590_058972 [Homalodisca vitripennis]